MEPMKSIDLPQHLHWREDGLPAILCPLELAVMEALWAEPRGAKFSVVRWHVDREYKPCAGTTVHVALSRLREKDWAVHKRPYWYAAFTEQELRAAAVARLEALMETLV